MSSWRPGDRVLLRRRYPALDQVGTVVEKPAWAGGFSAERCGSVWVRFDGQTAATVCAVGELEPAAAVTG